MSVQEQTQALQSAVRHFWLTRARQAEAQGGTTGERDARAAATGGAPLDGFADLVERLLRDAGLAPGDIHREGSVTLPGYFRPETKWDLVVVVNGQLLAAVEFRAQDGPSFGDNYNNRTEEALGSATDYWTAYREGAFAGSPRPWLGCLMLLEDAFGSAHPVSVAEPHFRVFPEFRDASYARRYEILLTKMVRERLYDAACLLLSPRNTGSAGDYREPAGELAFANFAMSLVARALAYVRTHG